MSDHRFFGRLSCHLVFFPPSLFSFVDEEWQRDHNFMGISYRCLLTTFNHYLLGQNEESLRTRWSFKPLALTSLSILFLSPEPFCSSDWNIPMRTMTELEWNTYPSYWLNLYLSTRNAMCKLHYTLKSTQVSGWFQCLLLLKWPPINVFNRFIDSMI